MILEEQQSDLACRLLAADGMELRDEYVAMFDQTRRAATRRMHEPSAPNDFSTAQALADCSALATDILNEVWERLHESELPNRDIGHALR